jgi:adenine/guanine phosphoribosyltransferase-like PRPP-binding protein
VWPGQWVADHLPLTLTTTHSPVGLSLADLVGLAVRRNPRRAHLLVSRVLGKHVPTDPRIVLGAGLLLGELVRLRLESREPTVDVREAAEHLRAAQREPASDHVHRLMEQVTGPVGAHDVVVLGYAETATALGDAVAERLGAALYLHSTRRSVPGLDPYGGFEESHSHATSHLLLPAHASLLDGDRPLVLVDDELSTGSTALGTIEALHQRSPRAHYVVAALVDLRSDDDRERFATLSARLDAAGDVVSLSSGTFTLPPDVLDRGRRLVEEVDRSATERPHQQPKDVRELALGWPRTVPETARHGVSPVHRAALAQRLPQLAQVLADAAEGGPPPDVGSPLRVLVLGTEELMAAPLRLAAALQYELTARGRVAEVRFSTTTRSPVLPLDDAGYAIRTTLTFDAFDAFEATAGGADHSPSRRFAYNVAGAAGSRPYDVVLLVTDDSARVPHPGTEGGLLGQLGAAARQVVVVTLPCAPPDVSLLRPIASSVASEPRSAARQPLPEPLRGPRFGSYAADEVAWLLTDLSHLALEAPVEEREEAVQSGGAHYAESLPVEYQPTPEYVALFETAVHESAARVAAAVGVVTELVLAERGRGAVLASLARAGTPIGILMRRWAAWRYGLDLPHYAVSIVRGRGIDTTALEYLARHHDPGGVVFVDGWTGKGAIARELTTALARYEAMTGVCFDPSLAVLADPGHCVRTFGTRDDFLVPSACLNSTVSGLVSRTVLNDAVIGPRDFHGAKFYADLAADDVSGAFLDAVTERFDDVVRDVESRWPQVATSDRALTWVGWRAVDRISHAYGIGDVNLVKPGVGETTRVLLRRVPWRVLVRREAAGAGRRSAGHDLRHVLLLAEQRGVPVEEVDGLPYRCVGLIHPRFTRGATGADGTAVASNAHLSGNVHAKRTRP